MDAARAVDSLAIHHSGPLSFHWAAAVTFVPAEVFFPSAIDGNTLDEAARTGARAGARTRTRTRTDFNLIHQPSDAKKLRENLRVVEARVAQVPAYFLKTPTSTHEIPFTRSSTMVLVTPLSSAAEQTNFPSLHTLRKPLDIHRETGDGTFYSVAHAGIANHLFQFTRLIHELSNRRPVLSVVGQGNPCPVQGQC